MPADELAAVPYDYARLSPPGALLFTAGACPLDADGRVVAPGDHQAQAHRAVDNLLLVLAQHGAARGHLVRTTVYVVGTRENVAAVWEVVAGRLAPSRPPSTLLGVSLLGFEHQLVEIDGVASVAAEPSAR